VRIATLGESGAESVFRRIVLTVVEMVKELNGSGDCLAGIGIGAPGPLDARSGVVQTMPNLPGWDDFPLKARLEEATGCDVCVMNDADAVAWGEYAAGAAMGRKNFAVVTLGTGVGSSLFFNGKPWIGVDGFSSELGHVPVSPDGPQCSCGRIGHLESFVSSRRIVESVVKAVGNGVSTHINISQLKKDGYHIKAVADAALAGDELALSVMKQYGSHLGRGLAVLANLLNLPLVVLAGGITAAWPVFEKYTRETLAASAFPIQAASLEIKLSELGDDAGIIGAAMSLIFS
jgi:glucokinase